MLVTLMGYGLKDDISNKDFNLYLYTRTAKFTSKVEKTRGFVSKNTFVIRMSIL